MSYEDLPDAAIVSVVEMCDRVIAEQLCARARAVGILRDRGELGRLDVQKTEDYYEGYLSVADIPRADARDFAVAVAKASRKAGEA